MALLVADGDLAVMDALAEAMVLMTEAEVFQLERKRGGELTEDDYLRIIRQKTATFMSACCRIGGLAGGPDGTGGNALGAHGERPGVAVPIIHGSPDFGADQGPLREGGGGRPRRGVPPSGPPSGIVTLLTDFGLDDAYVGVVKGAILGIHPAVRLVDLTHGVPPQDVRHGAVVLTDAYQVFPPGTVHLAVVDPGVGTRRRALALRADGHYFVGPDNGLLGFCATLPGMTAVALENPRYHRQPTSRTFHARDVFAPAAAHLARGLPLGRLG